MIDCWKGLVRLLGSAGLTIFLLLSAPPVSAAEESLKIGLTGPFTGGSAPMGNSMRLGVRMAVEEINEYVGGVLGRRIELVERDDEANPQKGAAIAQELIERQKVVATIGIVNTGVGLTSIDHYQKAKVPLIVAVATGSELTARYAPTSERKSFIFRVSPRTEVSARFLARHLVRDRGFQRIAILADETGYGAAERADLEAALAALGVYPVTVQRFFVGDRDMKKQLAAAQRADAQVVVMFGVGPDLAAIARDRAAMGWSVPLYGSWAVQMRSFLDQAGAAGEGVMAMQTFIPGSQNARHRQFVEDFRRRYGDKAMESAMSAAQGYDAMRLLFSALEAAQSSNGDRVRTALEQLDRGVEGVVTTYIRPFSDRDHDAITENMLVLGVVRNGKIDYAYEEDARRSLVVRRKQGGETR
jgi:branched-chain amino acid transport system substrate-binding protein